VKAALLDVNVLIALLWPAHEHHAAAHGWFRKIEGRSWATCPLTELAFIRIVSNPAFSSDALSPAAALSLLDNNLEHPSHVFWPDDLPVRLSLFDDLRQMEGHRQVTDLYLLALAKSHKGALVTFDAGLIQLASGRLRNLVECIQPGRH
jgi:toxin-antitoxin system PIN domain toxin